MRSQASSLAALLTLEMGKRTQEAEEEVALSSDILSYYAAHGASFLQDQPVPNVPGAFIVSESIGVILAVEPWNFPCYQLARVASPQLVAGNVVIAKHACNDPQLAAAFARLFEEAGAPEGVYMNLFCGFEQVNWLIDDFRVRGVTLTGSEGAGGAVAERGGKTAEESTVGAWGK